jgi:hypothetical protein
MADFETLFLQDLVDNGKDFAEGIQTLSFQEIAQVIPLQPSFIFPS